MSSESNVLSGEVATVEDALGVFLSLDGVEEKLSMCHSLLVRAAGMEEDLDQLKSHNETFRQVEADIEFGNCILAVYDFVDLDSKVPEALDSQRELEVLIKSREYLISIETTTNELKARREVLGVIPEMAQAEKALGELKSLIQLSLDLQRVDEAISQAKSSRERVASRLDEVLREYQERLLEAKRCPICFGPVDEHSIERILEELTSDGKSGSREDGSRSNR